MKVFLFTEKQSSEPTFILNQLYNFLLLEDMYNIYQVEKNMQFYYLFCGETESTTTTLLIGKGVK